MRIGGLALLAIGMLGAPAHAGSDYRWHDRFFWGLEVGKSEPELEYGESYDTTFGIEESYWANDYVGGRVAFETSQFSDDWGVELYGALPLRYVQLYGGLHLGLRNPEDVSSGVDPALWPVAGIQGYLGRNGRLFVQWNNLKRVDLGDPQREPVQYRDSVVVVGLRWSPDWFHRAKPLTKLDLVYGSALLTFALWGSPVSASKPVAFVVLPALVSALIYARAPASAEDCTPTDGGTACGWSCAGDSPKAGQSVPDGMSAACFCYDSCGDGGGGGGQQQTVGGQALIKGLGAIAVTIMFFIVPGRTLALYGGDKIPAATYRAQWATLQQSLRDYIRAGREARKAAAALRLAEANAVDVTIATTATAEAELATRRETLLSDDVAEDKVKTAHDQPALKPFPRVALESSRDFECHRAELQMPYSSRYGAFASLQEFQDTCGPFATGQPVGGPNCVAAPDGAAGQVCCPNGATFYNTCDSMCYPDRGSLGGDETAVRCKSTVDTRVGTP